MTLEKIKDGEFRLVGSVMFDNVLAVEKLGGLLLEESLSQMEKEIKCNGQADNSDRLEWGICLANLDQLDSSALALLISWRRWGINVGVHLLYKNTCKRLKDLILVCGAQEMLECVEES